PGRLLAVGLHRSRHVLVRRRALLAGRRCQQTHGPRGAGPEVTGVAVQRQLLAAGAKRETAVPTPPPAFLYNTENVRPAGCVNKRMAWEGSAPSPPTPLPRGARGEWSVSLSRGERFVARSDLCAGVADGAAASAALRDALHVRRGAVDPRPDRLA